MRAFASVFLLPLLFFIEIPDLNSNFWVALFIVGTINSVGMILYMKALKSSDLSVTVPMIAFLPLFLLITSPIIIKEIPSIFGFVGVLLIVVGSYFLNIKQRNKGIFTPFKALVKENGPKFMLGVAFLYSISANFDKIGVLNSSSIFWAIAVNCYLTISLFSLMLFKSKPKSFKKALKNYKKLFLIGLSFAIVLLCYAMAIKLVFVSYVVSVRRMSILFSVLFGHFIFKENNIKERLLGSIIMLIGVLFITFLG